MKAERDYRNMPPEKLTHIEQQLRALQRNHSQPQTCPACHARVSAYEASGRRPEDEEGNYQGKYFCTHCHRELELVVPFISLEPYLWVLAEPLPPLPK